MERKATPESALAYYLSNRPVSPRATFQMWLPILQEMIKDRIPAKDAHAWLVAHDQHLGLPIPAATTLRDWLSNLRQSKDELPENSRELQGTGSNEVLAPASIKNPELYRNVDSTNEVDSASASTVEHQSSAGVRASQRRKASPASSQPSESRAAKAEKLESIKRRRLELPLKNRALWGEHFLLLQIEEFKIIEEKEPDSVDIADMRKGHENVWRKLHKKVRSAE